MRSDKRYSNATFTKRVDHEALGQIGCTSGGPAVCKFCGAFCYQGRWAASATLKKGKRASLGAAEATTCPACNQLRWGIPGGYVHLDGGFLAAHRDEIERLLANEAARASEANPLARILTWDKGDRDRLTVTTTTERLAQRLGRALEKAFDGELRYGFSHENKFARVWWHRN